MANQEHLIILKQGVGAWNDWRRTDVNLNPDLSKLDLRSVNIRDARLYGTNLSEANLSGLDLRTTYLGGADLRGANLSGANLTKVCLHQVNLDRADLRGTNLSGAELNYAKIGSPYFGDTDLSHAELIGADFRFAFDLAHVNFSGANLSKIDLSEKRLRGVNLSGAALHASYLREADLKGANLYRANLFGAYLSWADLSGANLREAILFGAYLRAADLSGADLSHADLRKANFSWTDIRALEIPRSAPPRYAGRSGANLSGADLSGADLSGADLSGTDLRGAKLCEANLSWSNLSGADLSGANLTGSFVYAASVWDVKLAGATQSNLIITAPALKPSDNSFMPLQLIDKSDEPAITVDDLEVAQFIYLLLNNKKIRSIVDTITSKVVLILGRFTPERKVVLDAIKNELRQHNYTPVLFDFEKPSSRDLTETVSILAHLARFIIVDLTEPSSVPHEVSTIIPNTVVPVQPLFSTAPLHGNEERMERREYGMFEDLRRRHPWVLPTFHYQDTTDLLASLKENVIDAAERKVQDLAKR